MRGLVPSLLKNSVSTGAYFSILFYLEQIATQINIMDERKNQAVCGGVTKAILSVLSNPIIVIKTRLEVVGFNEYNGILDACR